MKNEGVPELRFGGYYKARNGAVFGPLVPTDDGNARYCETYPFMDREAHEAWTAEGFYWGSDYGDKPEPYHLDLIEEVEASKETTLGDLLASAGSPEPIATFRVVVAAHESADATVEFDVPPGYARVRLIVRPAARY